MEKEYISYCDRETEENNYNYDCPRLDRDWDEGDDPCITCCHRRYPGLKIKKRSE